MAKTKTNSIVQGAGKCIVSVTRNGLSIKVWENDKGKMAGLSRNVASRGNEPEWRNMPIFLNQLHGLREACDALIAHGEEHFPEEMQRSSFAVADGMAVL